MYVVVKLISELNKFWIFSVITSDFIILCPKDSKMRGAEKCSSIYGIVKWITYLLMFFMPSHLCCSGRNVSLRSMLRDLLVTLRSHSKWKKKKKKPCTMHQNFEYIAHGHAYSFRGGSRYFVVVFSGGGGAKDDVHSTLYNVCLLLYYIRKVVNVSLYFIVHNNP